MTEVPCFRPDALLAVAGLVAILAAPLHGQDPHAHHDHPAPSGEGLEWRMPPMDMRMMESDMRMMDLLPGMASALPDVRPFLPGVDVDPATLPHARSSEEVVLEDGAVLDLEAGLVRGHVRGRSVVLYGFNGQVPGPKLRVRQGTEVTIRFRNATELPLTLRWHGVRVESASNGVPGLNQAPVQPGATFEYRVRFPDPGVYWYHPHQHQDAAQNLGLHGAILVEPPGEDYYGPANREETLILNDLLADEHGLTPWGREAPTHVLMGRFGNVLLVNGSEDYRLDVGRGEVVRLQLVNAANTRTFNLHFGDARLKLVAADASRLEHEQWISSLVIGPGERYVVDALFEEPGRFAITNRVHTIDHFFGEFFPQVDTLGAVEVQEERAEPDHGSAFATLRSHPEVSAEIDAFRPHFDQEPDRELVVNARVGDMPLLLIAMLRHDSIYSPPMEWEDPMPMMNWLVTSLGLSWVMHEPDDSVAQRDVRPAVGWRFRQGDVVKLRIYNSPKSIHPMHHPIHLQGQRFLVVERDGVRQRNLAWRNTVLIPTGSTMDILVEMSNPGAWMINCQIPEHLAAGMAVVFNVVEVP